MVQTVMGRGLGTVMKTALFCKERRNYRKHQARTRYNSVVDSETVSSLKLIKVVRDDRAAS